MDDEIKLIGLEALAPEELEFNSVRLRTFEEARLEIVTYVEAKFGLMIPLMLTLSILLHPAKEKGHRVHEMVVSSAVELTFNETAMHANPRKGNGKQPSGKGKQSMLWLKSADKGKSKEGQGDGKSKGISNGARGSFNGETSKTVLKT